MAVCVAADLSCSSLGLADLVARKHSEPGNAADPALVMVCGEAGQHSRRRGALTARQRPSTNFAQRNRYDTLIGVFG